jgi:hypothetical protein
MSALLRSVRQPVTIAAVLGAVVAVSVLASPSGALAADPPFVSSTTLSEAGTQAFGSAVAADGDTIVVGAPETNHYRGAVYVFTKGAAGWAHATLTATLTASDALPGDEFGHSVAIDGDTIVAGATQDLRAEFGTNPPPGEGAVYVFNKPAAGWADATQSQELTEFHGRPADELGFSVAISGNTIVAGTPGLLNPTQLFSEEGGAQIFTRSASGWTQTPVATLTVADATPGDDDGLHLAIDGRTVVLSSPAGGRRTPRARRCDPPISALWGRTSAGAWRSRATACSSARRGIQPRRPAGRAGCTSSSDRSRDGAARCTRTAG